MQRRSIGRLFVHFVVSLCVALGLSAQPAAAQLDHAVAVRLHAVLPSFKSEQDLRRFLLKRREAERARYAAVPLAVPLMAPPPPAPPAPSTSSPAMGQVVVTAQRKVVGITNNQEVGVDEGDIVKATGDFLVILRRGRLFTVSLAGGRMTAVDHIAVSPPGVDASGDWYDEMLLHGDRVVVVGYSYSRGGTEVNRFRLDQGGHLRFEDAYHLKSNDYYSDRNYSSRLIGNQLIFYSPLYLGWSGDPLEAMPGLQRWRGEASHHRFRPIITARQIYVPPALRDDPEANIDALHTVTSCDVTAPVLRCSATAVLGPESRTFYVSETAVYVWLSHSSGGRRAPRSLLIRIPLNGRAPSALGVRGAPTDQFSFRESQHEHGLDVLVRAEGGGDAMFRPGFTRGGVALLHAPLANFGDGAREVAASRYRLLPRPRDDGAFVNRFVGDYVLYGVGSGWGPRRDATGAIVAASVRTGVSHALPLKHGVDRIEALGPNALAVGSDNNNLTFSAIDLSRTPVVSAAYTLRASSEGETRSHGFFFRPDEDDGRSGVLGLPVALPGRPAYEQLSEMSASLVFLRWSGRLFGPLGELPAAVDRIRDDDCQASCVDWYGNARPIFLGSRTFALMGYELVEGELSITAIREVGRLNFTPPSSRPGEQ